MEEVEIWKEVVGFSRYKVSNFGRLWDTDRDVEISQVLTGKPQYYYVNVCTDGGERKLKRLHILVAEAFVQGKTEDARFVDHIDRNKLNNFSSNLQWSTHRDNMRNKDNSLYFEGVLLKEYVTKYENPDAAYTYIAQRMLQGLSEEECLSAYEDHLVTGLRKIKVLWEGEQHFLNVLCKKFNVGYELTKDRLESGWDIWNCLMNIPSSISSSFEVIDSKGVGHWYKDNKCFESAHPNCLKVYRDLVKQGLTLERILQYDGLDHTRREVGGVYGTMDYLCKHFGKTRASVDTRMRKGFTLEEALTSPPQRVNKVVINGISGSPKYWYEYYGLDYKKTKSKKDKLKCSFEEILEVCGVDTTSLQISYTD